MEHSLAVTSAGRLFAWGAAGDGRLGVEAGAAGGDALRPRLVAGGALEGVRVAGAAAGERHSACFDDEGRLYTWGFGGARRSWPARAREREIDVVVPMECLLAHVPVRSRCGVCARGVCVCLRACTRAWRAPGSWCHSGPVGPLPPVKQPQAPHRSHSRGRRVPPHLALLTRQSRGDGRWRPHLTAAERTLIGR